MCLLVDQNRESSEGCGSRLFCELFMALFIPTRTDSIVHLRFQFLIAGNVLSMIPVVWFTSDKLILDTNRTLGGALGYSGPHVILNSYSRPSKTV